MNLKFVALLSNVLIDSLVNADGWSQRQMTAERKGMWVKTSGIDTEPEPVVPSPTATLSSSETAPTTIPAVYFSTSTNFFNLKKASQPVIRKDGKVIFVTQDCQLYILNSASVANWNSDNPLYVDKSLQDPSELFNLAACFDVILDAQENIYVLRTDVNGSAYINGWTFSGSSPPIQFLNGTSGIYMQGELRYLVLFSIGLTHVPSDGSPTSKGKIWVPLSGVTGVGLSVLDIDSQQVTTISKGPDNDQGMAGGAGVYNVDNPSSYITLFANDGEFFGAAPFMSAWSSSGQLIWDSSAILEASSDQPPPLIDVANNRVFAMEHPLANDQTRLVCINIADGTSCDNYGDTGVVIADAFTLPDGSKYNISWIYSGASVQTSTSITRLIYSVDLNIDFSSPAEPTGCLIAIDPTFGTELDYYCIPRDPSSFYATFNYLASAPLVAKNARGMNKHTVYVALGDLTIYAFDPMNLASGPLFSVLPTSTRKSGGKALPTGKTATFASDFLAMDPSGTLLMTYWDDYVGGESTFGVIAVPNINSFGPSPTPVPSPSFSPNPQPGGNNAVESANGLSPGASAAVSIVVLGIVGVLAYQVYIAGSFMGGIERIANGVKSAVTGGTSRPSYSYSQYATSSAATTPLTYSSSSTSSASLYSGGFQSVPGPTQL